MFNSKCVNKKLNSLEFNYGLDYVLFNENVKSLG